MLGFVFDTGRFGTCFFLRGGKCFNQMFRGRGYGAGGRIRPSSFKVVNMRSFNLHIILKLKLLGFVLMQVIFYQRHSFLHQLTQNMTTDCLLNYEFSTGKLQVQYMSEQFGFK